jgi:hypothetical protein
MKAAAPLFRSHGWKTLPPKNRIHVSRLVSAQYSPEYWSSLSGEVITDDPFHPLRLKLAKSRAERDPKGLWWHVHSNLELSSKRAVRSWSQRRVRQAFKDALSLRGYDELGVPLAQIETPSKVIDHLQGTLRILPNHVSITAKYDILKMECLKLVDDVIRKCKGPAASTSKRIRN